MSFFIFLTVVQALIAAALVGVILMQRSEGGGLGVGGNPSGIMSARGAADFLTRATAILATLFVLLSIVLAALAVQWTGNQQTVGVFEAYRWLAAALRGEPAAADGAAMVDRHATAPMASVNAHLVRALAPPHLREQAGGEGAVVVVDSPRGDAYEVDGPAKAGGRE